MLIRKIEKILAFYKKALAPLLKELEGRNLDIYYSEGCMTIDIDFMTDSQILTFTKSIPFPKALDLRHLQDIRMSIIDMHNKTFGKKVKKSQSKGV